MSLGLLIEFLGRICLWVFVLKWYCLIAKLCSLLKKIIYYAMVSVVNERLMKGIYFWIFVPGFKQKFSLALWYQLKSVCLTWHREFSLLKVRKWMNDLRSYLVITQLPWRSLKTVKVHSILGSLVSRNAKIIKMVRLWYHPLAW